MSDQEVLEGIKEGNSAALADVYKSYRDEYIFWASGKFDCSVDELKDSYQYAILVLYKNIVDGRLVELTSNLKTYIFSVGRNRLLKTLERQRKHNNFVLEIVDDSERSWDEQLAFERDMEIVSMAMDELGEPCRSMIRLSFFEKKSISELTSIFSYKNTDTTKNQKYKCINRLRKIALRKSA